MLLCKVNCTVHLLHCFILSVALYGCRSHLLEDGRFALTTNKILRDDCHVAGTLSWLQGGVLTTTGHLAHFAFLDNKLELQGSYKAAPLLSGYAEQLVMDGSLKNDWMLLNGQQCLVDSLNLHIETTTVDENNFTGKAALTFQSFNTPMCNCRHWYLFTAKRVLSNT